MESNIGWLFYRDYYKDSLNLRPQRELEKKKKEEEQETYYKKKNEKIINANFPTDTIRDLLKLPDSENNKSFSLKTMYPGMLIGTGYTHETKMVGEIKNGFFFDHTTGLPIVPGSSVKGILRSVFPNRSEKDTSATAVRVREQRIAFLRNQLKVVGVVNWTAIDLKALEAEIFDGLRDGKAVPLPQRDIFGDAYPLNSDNTLLGYDFITPHGKNGKEEPTKNPTPLQLLRIMPGVTFMFQFRLIAGLIGADEKKKLFEKIILHFGVGAKTNVGYGRFKAISTQQEMDYNPATNLSLLPDKSPMPKPANRQQKGSIGSSLAVDAEIVLSAIERTKPKHVAEPYPGKIKPGVQLDGEYIEPIKNTRNRHYCKVWLVTGEAQAKEIRVECMYASPLTQGQVIRIQVKEGKDKINLAEIIKIYQ